jgi:hypothetical protein
VPYAPVVPAISPTRIGFPPPEDPDEPHADNATTDDAATAAAATLRKSDLMDLLFL